MEIRIWKVSVPSNYENIEELSNLIGKSRIKAYSIDKNDNSIVEGEGWIASNESYNYHNNYDDSKDCMYFTKRPDGLGVEQWFTLNYGRVLEVQRENNKIILEVLEPIVNLAKENL